MVKKDTKTQSWRRTFPYMGLLALLLWPTPQRAQHLVAEGTTTEASATGRLVDALSGEEVISRMIENNQMRTERLSGYSAIRKYEIQNSDGKVSAQAVVQEIYRAPGTKTFSKISEQGSAVVRHLVFDRLLQTEEDNSLNQERGYGTISPANYRFTLLGTADLEGRACYVFRATPIRPDRYSFDGKIWVDAQDFGIARISGQPAKKPSFWIKHAEFLRIYQRIGGFWLPLRDETTVEMKANGTKLFRIEHQEYRIQVAGSPQTVAMDGGN